MIATSALCIASLVLAGPEDLETERISIQTSGVEGNERSSLPAISQDGRFVAFESFSSDLVAGDTNFTKDVFLHDRLTGTTTRVSVSSGGGQANGTSTEPDISADGRFITFTSSASNLVAGDTNGAGDVFVHDTQTSETTRVSVGQGLPGAQANNFNYNGRISSDGNFVVFVSAATNIVSSPSFSGLQVYRRELATGTNELVSVSDLGNPGDNASWFPCISADGGIVAFQSTATNFAPADTNGHLDIFVRDLSAGTTTRISESTLGVQGNSFSQHADISDDGRYVAFESRATSLDPADMNGYIDVYLHDSQLGTTVAISVRGNGDAGNNVSQKPSISGDGRFIAFESWTNNLAPRANNGYLNILVRDTLSGATRLMSLSTAGQQTNNHSFEAAISGDGKYVAFQSDASNLAADDMNGWGDIFVHDSLGEAAVMPRNAGLNPMSYTASVPTLGQTWDVSVDVSTTGHTSAMLVGKLGTTNLTLGSGYELLISGPRAFQLAPQLGPLVQWSIPLPDDSSLAGIRVYTQAVHLFGITPIALSNAQDLCIGY